MRCQQQAGIPHYWDGCTLCIKYCPFSDAYYVLLKGEHRERAETADDPQAR